MQQSKNTIYLYHSGFEHVFTSKKITFSHVNCRKMHINLLFCMLPLGSEREFTSKIMRNKMSQTEFFHLIYADCLKEIIDFVTE